MADFTPTPTLPPSAFDALRERLTAAGPAAAADALCDELRAAQDYAGLFYALLLKGRLSLGVSPVPTGPARDLPESAHAAYEGVIRDAGREVGNLFLAAGDIPRAWEYFRMLGEPAPVVAAIDRYEPGEEDDPQAVIAVAFSQGVSPRRGYELILNRYGVCTAITALSGYDLPFGPEAKVECVKLLVRALHDQLRERLANEVRGRGEVVPAGATVAELIAGRDWLFENDNYHIDVSHLSSVVHFAAHLPPGGELRLARQLCLYGERLSPMYRSAGEPPFDEPYRDHGVYLAALAGEDVEAALAHFRAKADAAAEEGHPAAAEALVNLLLKMGRPAEAAAAATRYLTDGRPETCPTVIDLCLQTGDHAALAEAARRRGDAVHYLAGLIANAGGRRASGTAP